MVLHVVLLSIGLGLSVVFLFYKLKFSYWRRLGVPHPQPSFPCGNIDGTAVQVAFGIDKLYRNFKDAAGLPFFGFYFMHQPWAMLTDLELIKSVFIRDFRIFPERDLYSNEKEDPLSAHLSAVGFHKWRSLRPKLSPSFTSGKMRAMVPVMMEACGDMVTSLDGTMKSGNDHEIEVKDVLGRLYTDIISRCVFGVDCKATTDELRKIGKKAFDVPRFSGLTINVIKSWKSVCQVLGVKVVLDDVSSFFMDFMHGLIKYRQTIDSDRSNNVVDQLIRLKNTPENPLRVDEVAAHSFILFLAGFENASLSLAFTLYELALNPEIQCKARAEIRAVVDQLEDGILTYDAIMKMTYIEQVLIGKVLTY